MSGPGGKRVRLTTAHASSDPAPTVTTVQLKPPRPASVSSQHFPTGNEPQEHREQPEETLRVQGRPDTSNAVPPIVHEALRSPGEPLDPSTRAVMELRFGHNFAQVRVHTDARAAEATRQLDSLAFTSGQDIFFGAGSYRPDSQPGRRLLAHELAHTLQQRAAQSPERPPIIQRSLAVSQPNEPLEREAAAAAERVAAGQKIPPGVISLVPTPATGLIARQVATLAAPNPAARASEAEELVENLVRSLLRTLRADPEDRLGRIRRRLARLAPSTRETALERLEATGSPEQWAQLTRVLAKPLPAESEAQEDIEETDEPEFGDEPSSQSETEEAPGEPQEPEPGVPAESESEAGPTADVAEASAAPAVDLEPSEEALPDAATPPEAVAEAVAEAAPAPEPAAAE